MKQTIDPIQPNAVYKADEAARLLRVDRSAIYKAYNSGELKGKEIGKGLKFLGNELLQYAGTATIPKLITDPNHKSSVGAVSINDMQEIINQNNKNHE
jgi:hypothetical protein